MTVKDTFNSLGDGFRNAYGITDQLTFAQMNTMINDLVPKTIIELDTVGFTYPSNNSDDTALTGSGKHTPLFNSRTAKQNTDLLNSLFMLGRSTITISYDIEWPGFKPTSDINSVTDRIGYELNANGITNSNYNYINCWTYLNKESGKEHRVKSYTINQVQFGDVLSSSFYVQANVDKVKVTNFKIVQNPILDATNYALGITNNAPWCSWLSFSEWGYNCANYTISKDAIGDTADPYVDAIHSNIDTSISRGVYRLSFWYRSDVESSDNIQSLWYEWNDKSLGYQDNRNFFSLKKIWNLYTQDIKYDPDDATLGNGTNWIIRTERKYLDDNRFYPYTLQVRDLSLTKISDL
jgi:hypothetical protein